MNKVTITVLSIVAIVFLLVGAASFGGALANATAVCQASSDPNCARAGGANIGAGFGLLICGLGVVAALIAWMVGLVRTAQIGRWGWFAGVLFLSPLASLIYGLVGPTERRAKNAAQPSSHRRDAE